MTRTPMSDPQWRPRPVGARHPIPSTWPSSPLVVAGEEVGQVTATTGPTAGGADTRHTEQA
jgi:hypothetical protein